MLRAIDQELAAMRTCAEALEALGERSQAKVLNWLAQSFAPQTKPSEQQSQPAAVAPLSPIQEHVQSQAFLSLRTVQEKFLSILDLLRRLHPDPKEFLNIACAVPGRSRRYFARTPQEIEESGSGAKAARVTRNYPLYVDVNNSTESKRRILWQLMDDLGYDESDRVAAVAALRRGEAVLAQGSLW
jgi:negative regulator of replication initiation